MRTVVVESCSVEDCTAAFLLLIHGLIGCPPPGVNLLFRTTVPDK